MRKIDLQSLSRLIIINKKTLAELDPSITEGSLNSNISRWIADGTLILLKKGVYISAETYRHHKNDFLFQIYLANSLVFPSYVTAETILRQKEALTEATFGMTSFTLKTTRKYENLLGTFSYSTIKEQLYTGFQTAYFLDHRIYAASTAKALFDFLYMRSSIIPNSLKDVNLIEELRLNLDNFTASDLTEFAEYATIVPNSKMERIIQNITKYAPNHPRPHHN